MVRSTVAHVDLAALRINFRAIREFVESRQADLSPRCTIAGRRAPGVGPATPPGIIAVVKANAYGHGAERVALALEQAGATMLACADIEEGIVLRRAGVRVPILVFGALSVSDLDGLFEYLADPDDLDARCAARAGAGRRGTAPDDDRAITSRSTPA